MSTKKEAPVEKSIDEMTPEEMRDALLKSQLRTQLMQEKQASATADKFEHDTRTKEQKAAAAQREMTITQERKQRQKQECRHKQGGFGLEGTFKGSKQADNSLLEVRLCIPGQRMIYCYRCEGEWRTPQPSLEKTDPKEYARQMKEFVKIAEQMEETANRPVLSPVFAFAKNGAPFAPDLV